jgi:hypothetical protein
VVEVVVADVVLDVDAVVVVDVEVGVELVDVEVGVELVEVEVDVELVAVEVEVVVVGGGRLVVLSTTGVGFDVLTVEPFLLLAVVTSRKVKPASAVSSK